jgi:16S rRNA (guanine(966)-N(2))-methyltransferase RsmD
VTFIEQSRQACSVIEANLQALTIDAASTVNRDALPALKRFHEEQDEFDIIFFDPPYASNLYATVLGILGTLDILAPDGIVVVEHRVKTPPEAEYGELRLYRRVKQGESGLAFYARK